MLDDIKRTLWTAAYNLLANMDAAQYKHLVLGLIFVKYFSDALALIENENPKLKGILDKCYARAQLPVGKLGSMISRVQTEMTDEVLADKMQRLTEKLGEQMAKGAKLDQLIRQKLGGLGYEF